MPKSHRLAAIVLFAAAGQARAQSCLWTSPAQTPVQFASGYSVAAYDSLRARIIVVETNRPGTTAARTWSWDGSAWSLIDSAGPFLRMAACGAYDSTRDRLMLFGGQAANGPFTLGDTWEWNGAIWIHITDSGPPARRYGAMAYDSARHRMVLFGGVNSGLLGDTWEWDAGWTLRATTGPSPRATNCIAFDSARGRTVVYGTSYNAPIADLWEWDGAQWTQRPSTLPGPAGWMTFDPQRAKLILSIFPPQMFGQTWEMDSATAAWTLRDPGWGISGQAVFDIARGRAIVGDVSGMTEYDPAGTLTRPYLTQLPLVQTAVFGAPLVVSHPGGGSPPLTFRWYHNGQALTNGGPISGADTDTLTINPASADDGGNYYVSLTNGCGDVSAGTYISIMPICYPNCDNSTAPPILNANDFQCFLNKFAAGDPYANCDGSSAPPFLTANDFQCFLNTFAAGCS